MMRLFHALSLVLVWAFVSPGLAVAKDGPRASLSDLYARQNPRCTATSTVSNASWALVYGRCAALNAGMFFHKTANDWKPADCGLGDTPAAGSSPLTHCRLNASNVTLARAVIARDFSPVSKGLRAATKAGVGVPEVVIRYVADPEVTAVIGFGTVRGDRTNEHFATNDTYRFRSQAQARLALPVQPSLRLDMMVPVHMFSNASVVAPMFGQPGGGTERTVKSGRVPVIAIRVTQLDTP